MATPALEIAPRRLASAIADAPEGTMVDGREIRRNGAWETL
jgi:hypothetical protein